MKISIALTLCLALTTCNAGVFDGLLDTFHHIGDALNTAFHHAGDQAKLLGTNLLNTAVDQGKQLAGQTLQSLALGTVNAMQTDPRQARDIHDVLQQFQPALNNINHLIEEHAGQLNSAFHTTIDKLVEAGHKLTELSPEEISAEVDKIVAAHNTFADHLVAEFEHSLTTHHKRNSFTDALSSVGSGIAEFFKPHVDALKGIVSATGDTIKQTASTFGQTVTQSINQLGGKLQGHASSLSNHSHAILQHGTNAVNALKDAVSDALAQTLTHAQPHINNILQTGVSALGVAANHLTSSLGTALGAAIGAAVNGGPTQPPTAILPAS